MHATSPSLWFNCCNVMITFTLYPFVCMFHTHTRVCVFSPVRISILNTGHPKTSFILCETQITFESARHWSSDLPLLTVQTVQTHHLHAKHIICNYRPKVVISVWHLQHFSVYRSVLHCQTTKAAEVSNSLKVNIKLHIASTKVHHETWYWTKSIRLPTSQPCRKIHRPSLSKTDLRKYILTKIRD
jgi:hypothetical protein